MALISTTIKSVIYFFKLVKGVAKFNQELENGVHPKLDNVWGVVWQKCLIVSAPKGLGHSISMDGYTPKSPEGLMKTNKSV